MAAIPDLCCEWDVRELCDKGQFWHFSHKIFAHAFVPT
jgi:hypothetical protein